MISPSLGRGSFVLSLIMLVTVAAGVSAHAAEEDSPNMTSNKTSFYLTDDKGVDLRPAEEVKKELPEHMRDFVNKYEQVKKTQDEDLLAELIHPASKACEDDSNTDYFNNLRVFYLTEKLGEDYRLKIIPVAEEKRWGLKWRIGTPLAPTHVMYMEYVAEGNEIEGLQRYLREEDYPQLRMFELVKCPDEEVLEQFRQNQQSYPAEENMPETEVESGH